jgi:phage terminase small subunit
MPSQLPAPLTEGLTAKQLSFVEHYVGLAGRHQGRAAIMAGYSRTGADAHASRLLRDPRILRVLRHYAETRIKATVVASAATLEELRDDLSAPQAVRLKAASELLDRAGLLVEKISTMHHIVSDQRRSNAGDLRELVDLVVNLDVGVVVGDPDKLQRALALAAQRDQAKVIDITPVEADDAVEPALAAPAPVPTALQPPVVADAVSDLEDLEARL